MIFLGIFVPYPLYFRIQECKPKNIQKIQKIPVFSNSASIYNTEIRQLK